MTEPIPAPAPRCAKCDHFEHEHFDRATGRPFRHAFQPAAASDTDVAESDSEYLDAVFMSPEELTMARHRLGLAQEGLARMGEPLGARVAESGRTVRRWESGSRRIPGPVALLVRAALVSPELRRLLELPAWPSNHDLEQV